MGQAERGFSPLEARLHFRNAGQRQIAQAVDQRVGLRRRLPAVAEPVGPVDGERDETLDEVGLGLRDVRDVERGERVGLAAENLLPVRTCVYVSQSP